MFIRKSCFKNQTIFNQDYFLYLEDLDLGYKVEQNNCLTFFDPRSKIYHYGGGSTKNKFKTNLNAWKNSRTIFVNKHFKTVNRVILKAAFLIEAVLLFIYHKIMKTIYV